MGSNLEQHRPVMAAPTQSRQQLRPVEVAVTERRLDLAVAPLFDVNHRHVRWLDRLDNASDGLGYLSSILEQQRRTNSLIEQLLLEVLALKEGLTNGDFR